MIFEMDFNETSINIMKTNCVPGQNSLSHWADWRWGRFHPRLGSVFFYPCLSVLNLDFGCCMCVWKAMFSRQYRCTVFPNMSVLNAFWVFFLVLLFFLTCPVLISSVFPDCMSFVQNDGPPTSLCDKIGQNKKQIPSSDPGSLGWSPEIHFF